MKCKTDKTCPSQAYKVLWSMIGKEVIEAVGNGRNFYIPYRWTWRDFGQATVAQKLVSEELEFLTHDILMLIDFDEEACLFEMPTDCLMEQCRISCDILGISSCHAQTLAVMSLLAAREWQTGLNY